MRYSTATESVPASAPMNRHPKGFMPHRAMPSEMIVLPSGGCEVSVGSRPRSCSHALRAK